jgi:hypothetical protein
LPLPSPDRANAILRFDRADGDMTAAELLIGLVVFCGLLWLLTPLRSRLSRWLSRMLRGSKHGQVIDADFRVIKPDRKGDP